MYIISSDLCNGWSLAKGLRELHIAPHELAYRRGEPAGFDLPGRGFSSLDRSYSEGDTLLFTDERSLLTHLEQSPDARFYPKCAQLEHLIDKLLFSRLVHEIEGQPLGYVEPGSVCNPSALRLPMALRMRQSWKDRERLPRGKILREEEELTGLLEEMGAQEGQESSWFLQQYIPGPCEKNISVSGWQALVPGDSVYCVTRKLIQDKGPFGIGLLSEQIADPDSLVERAATLLTYIGYEGPFEMEFLYDKKKTSTTC